MASVLPVTGDDEPLFEVIAGRRVELEPMGAFQTVLATVLSHFISEYALKNRLGLPTTETLFVLDAEADLKRRPDVAFVSYDRWPEQTPSQQEAWDVVPDLAVEVISPSNLADAVDTKLSDYFNAGVRQVWVIYSKTRRIYVYSSPTQVMGFSELDTLVGGDVLPGFQLPIAELFAAVEKPTD